MASNPRTSQVANANACGAAPDFLKLLVGKFLRAMDQWLDAHHISLEELAIRIWPETTSLPPDWRIVAKHRQLEMSEGREIKVQTAAERLLERADDPNVRRPALLMIANDCPAQIEMSGIAQVEMSAF